MSEKLPTIYLGRHGYNGLVNTMASMLQDEGAKSFVKSWNELMSVSDALQKGN